MSRDGVVIVPYQDGPYLVRGPVALRDQDGVPIEAHRRTVALCRCGKSKMRPFCDGTHHLIRFRAASAAEAGRAPVAPREAAGAAPVAPSLPPGPPDRRRPADPVPSPWRTHAAAALRHVAARLDGSA